VSDVVIGDIIRKDRDDFVRISVKEYKRFPYVDIRSHFKDAKGEAVPTQKGITINPINIGRLIDLLVMARAELNKNNHSGSPY